MIRRNNQFDSDYIPQYYANDCATSRNSFTPNTRNSADDDKAVNTRIKKTTQQHSFQYNMFRKGDNSVQTVSNNITKIPICIYTVTRPPPALLFVIKSISHHILRNYDFLMVGNLVLDGEFPEFDAFKPRESGLEVSTDFTDIFRARVAAMSATRGKVYIGCITSAEF